MLAQVYLKEILVKIKGDRFKGSSYGYNRLENLSPLIFISRLKHPEVLGSVRDSSILPIRALDILTVHNV